MEGWIKLYRQIMENEVLWNNPEPFDVRSAWIDLLMLANHKEGVVMRGTKVQCKIPAGSFLTSIEKLANRWHWSEKKVRNFLGTLEGQAMLTKKGRAHGTLLTIVNYGFFQGQGRAQDRPQDRAQDRPQDRPQGTQTRITKNNKEPKEARTREGNGQEYGPVRRTSFDNFEQRHIDYDAMFDELRQKTGKAVI